MASTQHSISGATVQAPPVVQQLENIFAKLDDAPLLEALEGPVRRGPKGYPAKVLWRCYLTRYVLGLESTRALIRTLENNPFIAEACGVTGSVPHEATFSRFFGKLSGRFNLAKLKDVSRRLVRSRFADTPGFGQRVAIDSTTLKGWSNGGKKPRYSDKDAGWSVKKNTHGSTEFTYGYKLHLMVDCESELPIAANVTPGNVHDYTRASHLLSEARFTGARNPRFVIADKGYSGAPLFRLIQGQYGATPIIQVHPTHKRLLQREAESQNTPGWKALYKQRAAVERVFSRLKGQRSLNHIRVRGRMKVTVHSYLALIALQSEFPLPQAQVPLS